MEALRGWNARRRSPSFRALRDAGPPTAWLVLATGVGVAVVVGLFVLGVRDPTTLVAVPLIAYVVVCVADRDGWRIRMASAELAALQRQRWTGGRVPADQHSAERWLVANPNGSPVERAAMLLTVRRSREARDLIEAETGTTPEDSVRLERMRLTVDASLGEGALDRPAIEGFERLAELAAISSADRRYHRLSLAWSAAWLQIHANRPWRVAFTESLRKLGPFRPPLGFRIFHAVQQLALPIAYALAWLIVTWLGLTPWQR